MNLSSRYSTEKDELVGAGLRGSFSFFLFSETWKLIRPDTFGLIQTRYWLVSLVMQCQAINSKIVCKLLRVIHNEAVTEDVSRIPEVGPSM